MGKNQCNKIFLEFLSLNHSLFPSIFHFDLSLISLSFSDSLSLYLPHTITQYNIHEDDAKILLAPLLGNRLKYVKNIWSNFFLWKWR